MTHPATLNQSNSAGIVQRLREVQIVDIGDDYLVNPDGPEAADTIEELLKALAFYADKSNPRAWVQQTVVDAQHPHGRRNVGIPFPSEALLFDTGDCARAAIQKATGQ